MNDGTLNIGKYRIDSKIKVSILNPEDFNIVDIGENKVYLSKEPLENGGLKFWVKLYSKGEAIYKIELKNAALKFKMNYESMNEKRINELRKSNEEFLIKKLGEPKNRTVSGIEYEYSWGSIVSYFDNRSAEAGIVIIYAL